MSYYITMIVTPIRLTRLLDGWDLERVLNHQGIHAEVKCQTINGIDFLEEIYVHQNHLDWGKAIDIISLFILDPVYCKVVDEDCEILFDDTIEPLDDIQILVEIDDELRIIHPHDLKLEYFKDAKFVGVVLSHYRGW